MDMILKIMHGNDKDSDDNNDGELLLESFHRQMYKSSW